MKLTEIGVLPESFKTKDDSIVFDNTTEGLIAKFTFKEEEYTIRIQPFKLKFNNISYDAVNVGFTKSIDGKAEVNSTNTNSSSDALRIFSIVSNAVKEEIKKWNCHIIAVSGSDFKSKRIKIYQGIISRLVSDNATVFPFVEYYKNDWIFITTRKLQDHEIEFVLTKIGEK